MRLYCFNNPSEPNHTAHSFPIPLISSPEVHMRSSLTWELKIPVNKKWCTLICLKTKRTEEQTLSPNFLGGSSDENEKVLGKFLARLRRAKKGFPNFLPAAGFFSSWRHWKPLKTDKTAKKPLIFRIFSKNRQNFEKRDPKNFSPAPGFFSKKSSVDFTKVLGQSRGGQKHTSPPLWRGMMCEANASY